MENKLSWFDRVITPKTKAYKDFESQIKNTAPEIFFRDGERKFSNQEKRFIQIYNSKESQTVKGFAYTVNTIFDQETDTSVNTNFKSSGELVRFIDKQRTDNRLLIVQNNIEFTEVNIFDEASKQKFLSDSWAKELQDKTDLSFGMTNMQIDEKQADHYRKYEFYANETNSKVGKISFFDSSGKVAEVMYYESERDYISALERELESNFGGFKYETLQKSPNLVKKVDDLIFNVYGEENPNSLEYYTKIFDKSVQHIKNINNQNPKIMETQKEFDQVKYLKDQMKYLGFGEDEKLHKDLEKGINSKKQEFEIKTTSDKTLPENKVDFVLKFNKSESGGVFLNSYNAKLINEKSEELSHSFSVSRDSSFTAKEAINLLEGRSVKIEFHNPKKNNEVEPAFVQFNFNEPKTDKGNYLFQNFYKNYGVDTAKIIEKSNLVFDKPEWKESIIKSLEKGNVVKVKFAENDHFIEGKAVLDPQNRNLKLYDNEMNRLNTNKPLEGLEQDNKHDKANVREQSIKR
ncbi:hypothetical protein [Chryseobacterium sp.]|uniref:hypothetical protein n=1 Tax=Chryseobacterium sp. TaxID=1871047 RepID=UPI0028A27C15|nr:hypothetical protein [Chryseobacterium sp.]